MIEQASRFGLDILMDGYAQMLGFIATMGLLVWLGKARPSRQLLYFIVAPVPVMLLGLFWPVLAKVFYFYNPLLCLALLVDCFLLSARPKHIELTRNTANKLSIHQPNTVIINILNTSKKKLQGLIRDDLPDTFKTPSHGPHQHKQSITVEAGQLESVVYEVHPTRRGAFDLGAIRLTYQSGLKLLWLQVSNTNQDCNHVEVYPDLKRLTTLRVRYSKAMTSGNLQRRSSGMEGTQFQGLRNYDAGDDIKKLDWRATARMDKPIVRTFSHDVEQPVMLLIDSGRLMQRDVNGISKLDWAINGALSFASVALDRGDYVSLGVFSQAIKTWIPFGSGKKHLKRLVDGVTPVFADRNEAMYAEVMPTLTKHLYRRSLVVMFTDIVDELASANLIKNVQRISKHHLVILITMSNGELETLASQRPINKETAYQGGVALALDQSRTQCLSVLRKNPNIMVIDTPADKIDDALIQNYLHIKLKNKL